MSVDYLDLLLMRETRAAPLAEPRIEPASAAAAVASSPGWNEIVEEREAPIAPSIAGEERRADGEPRRREVEPQVQVDAAVFPPPPPDRLLEPPAPSEPRQVQRSARAVTDDDRQETPAAPRVQPPEVTAAVVATAPAMNAPDVSGAPGEARVAPARMRPPDEPREIATRRASPPPSHAAEPPAAAPVTIRIDRVEVRAAPAARPPAPAVSRPRPRVTLEEFLARRSAARHEER
jgi:hypothetical protein